MKRVVVTGLGTTSPLGGDVATTWAAMLAGESGVRPLKHEWAEQLSTQIAAEAAVSKLTVYSHFGDKESLFAAAVESHCKNLLPSSLFEPSPDTPLRERLLDIARAFYAMVSSPESVAGHRMLCTPQLAGTALSRMFWEAGPQRVHEEFTALLARRAATGVLAIDPDPAALHRAATQFFALVKGEPHAMLVFGCCQCDEVELDAHLTASVDLFLRAYGRDAGAR